MCVPTHHLFWNNEQNDCLYCPPNWIEWENNRCISFAVPAEGGHSYDQANNICHSLSAELLHVHDIDKFNRFQLQVNALRQSVVSSAVTIFLLVGAWIDGSDSKFIYLRVTNTNKKEALKKRV